MLLSLVHQEPVLRVVQKCDAKRSIPPLCIALFYLMNSHAIGASNRPYRPFSVRHKS